MVKLALYLESDHQGNLQALIGNLEFSKNIQTLRAFCTLILYKVRPDQTNMVVFFWYLVKSDAIQSTLLYSSLHWTSHSLHYTSTTRPCITGHPVYLKETFQIKYKKNQNLLIFILIFDNISLNIYYYLTISI